LADTERAPARSDLPVRAASAAVMIALAGTAFWLGGWALAGFIVAIGLGILIEWGLLVRAFERRPLPRALWLMFGVGYVGLGTVTALRQVAMPLQLLLIIASVIAVDVGAYFAGRAIGGPKIAPRISPSKTWAGLGGGMIGAIAVNAGWAAWLMHQQTAMLHALEAAHGPIPAALVPGFPWGEVVLAGVMTATIAQAGDFFESWLKRRAGVKDSGRTIPGHGGLFDRGDGLIAVLFMIGLVNLVVQLVWAMVAR